jgi:outer membrane lipoprotein SlyB
LQQEFAMRLFSRSVSVVVSAIVLAGLAACAVPRSPNAVPVANYPQQIYPAPIAVPQPGYTEFGRVTNVEVFQSQEPAPRTSGLGAVLGGVAGAVVGRQFGGGSGRDLGTVAGVFGGAIAGNAIEKSRNSGSIRESYRISIQLDNGGARAYDVPAYGDLRVGDRVRVDNGQISRL